MPQKKLVKLETEIKEIIIVNNKKLVPYIELVNFSSQNIDQKKLGTILGIFEIKDTSEDSAYIVNFLSSVAKKTYFASHQKNPEESFESTLAKVNLSLSEIAKHGNINWIGKIDAVLCSVFENQINFSVSGDAKVLLLRNNKLTEISAGLSPKDEAVNPLKTFTDIASGRLELEDKLILTTDDISHIFSIDDLEKYALSFKNDKFTRFLKTALVNELDIAGTIVIDTKKTSLKIKEKIKKDNISSEEASDKFNLFGNKAFEKKQKSNQEDSSVKDVLLEEKDQKNYVHKKTGHIYMSESDKHYENLKYDRFDQFLDTTKEKTADFAYWIKEKYFKKIHYKIKKNIILFFDKKNNPTVSPTTAANKTLRFSSGLSQKLKKIPTKLKTKLDHFTATKKDSPSITNSSAEHFSDETPTILSRNKISLLKVKSSFHKINLSLYSQKVTFLLKRSIRFLYLKIIDLLNLTKNLLPHFRKIKRIFLRMSLRMRAVTIIIIFIIFIVPLILVSRNDTPLQTSPPENSINSNEDLKINPSTQSYRESSILYQNSNLIGVFTFNNIAFAISKDKITQLGEKNKDFNFPENFRNAQYYSFMNDLNLLFLINDKNQIISFSPISLKFKEDSITIETNSKIEGIGTYLTYLYVVDSNNKQIYRYPRADNGFGEKINWLQSDINFESIRGIALDGNLYLAKKDTVLKLFNKKTQDFNLEMDSNASIDEIFTNEDLSNIYILDNLNGELDKFNKDGHKINFISNQNLTKATRIWIDEKNSTAYFIAENSLSKIALP